MRKVLLPSLIISMLLVGTALLGQVPLVLHEFSGLDGTGPNFNMILGNDGLLYGIAISGGVNPCAGSECGTAWKIDTQGNFTDIHDFPESGADPFRPLGGLILGADGFYYGTTEVGASTNFGTVFRMDSLGNLTVLHTFDFTDGGAPAGSLAQGADGTLYGNTANAGGSDARCTAGCGTLFSLDSGGTLTTLHAFDWTDGAIPESNVLFANDGNLYGTTLFGGNTSPSCTVGAQGCGTIYKSTIGGSFTTLYAFTGGDDGYEPGPTLLQASDGNLYGVTELGGVNGQGTIFKIDGAGTLTTIHSFDVTDGSIPIGGLMQATDGTILGTTEGGGTNHVGTIFTTDTAGNVTTLYSFDPATMAYPQTTLTQASDGNLYGTAGGGTHGVGTIYQFPYQCYVDVAPPYLFYPYICNIGVHHVTGGCGAGYYCPGDPVTRAQMAVFLLRGLHGAKYVPPHCAGVFSDVACPGGFAVDWIEELYNEHITGGCQIGPLLYCPLNPVTRAQMAAFLLKAEHGSGYVPPSCTGIFADVPCTPGAGFSDWIEELYHEGITGGCDVAPLRYCPGDPNTRGQMAVFIVKTFGLM
jgi:uncharacterized repeat protein (TIGR03803 family)